LLDEGVSANSVDCSPYSPPGGDDRDNCEPALIRATRYGQAGVAKLLISRGADVAARDASGRTAREVAQRLVHSCREDENALVNRCRRYQEVLRVLEQAESPRTAVHGAKRKG